jgi:hypothetical protein
MTEYMLAVHDDGTGDPASTMAPEDMQRVYQAVDEFNTELQAADAWVFAGGLQPPTSATTVRVQDGDVLITDGPFAETKEHLGGFWVIKAADLDAALDWAKRAAVACEGPVEVRPFQEEPES